MRGSFGCKSDMTTRAASATMVEALCFPDDGIPVRLACFQVQFIVHRTGDKFYWPFGLFVEFREAASLNHVQIDFFLSFIQLTIEKGKEKYF